MTYGGQQQVRELYHETCARHGRATRRLMCTYFIHFADTKAEEQAARARQIRYYKECVIAAFPGDPRTAPPSYRYFIGMVERRRNVRPEDLTENSVLLGSPAQITDTLKKVEAAGFDEVILYFNVGLKPRPQVKDEMARCMSEIAPALRLVAEGGERSRDAFQGLPFGLDPDRELGHRRGDHQRRAEEIADEDRAALARCRPRRRTARARRRRPAAVPTA